MAYIRRGGKKDKAVKDVDKKSLKEAVSDMNRLRPIKDQVAKLIDGVEGFAGIFISRSLVNVITTSANSKEVMDAILNNSDVDLSLVSVTDGGKKSKPPSSNRGLGFSKKPASV